MALNLLKFSNTKTEWLHGGGVRRYGEQNYLCMHVWLGGSTLFCKLLQLQRRLQKSFAQQLKSAIHFSMSNCIACHCSLPLCSGRIFQQQFCQVGKPVLVRGIRPGFLWDPDTLQRATLDLKGMYGARPVKSARRKQTAPPRPLTVSLIPC